MTGTESLLITTQNNAVRRNYVNVKIDNTQNSMSRLCSDKDEIVNYMIAEYSKQA